MKKICIADDEKDVLDVLEKKFRQNGYDVIAVSEGKRITEVCSAARPDLIILDIVMPESDGYSVAGTLRSKKGLEDVPIIFMTGKELDARGMQGRLKNFQPCDIIIKPCLFEDLLSKVQKNIG